MKAWDFLSENEKKAVESLKRKLMERFDVREMRLFGSKIRGQAGPDSDVDLMIELAKRSPEIESEIDDITFEVNLRNDSFKHSGVISYFNRRFVKPGIFSEELGRIINKAFDFRQRGDYREYEDLSYGLVGPFVDQSRIFVQAGQDYLQKNAFSQNS